MPRKPIDFSKCCFYRLVCKDVTVTECYVGHTTNEVNRRREHKSRCANNNDTHYNLFVYRYIRDHGGWFNWSLIVHEKLAVKDKAAAVLRERFWCEHYNATLNSNVPGQTLIEYFAANADKLKILNAEYRANYNAEHVEEIKASEAIYRATHVEEIKATKAIYRAAHVEEIKARAVKYYTANAERLKEKHTCECGGCYRTASKARHIQSKKHLKYV
jgi:hypothetical protein